MNWTPRNRRRYAPRRLRLRLAFALLALAAGAGLAVAQATGWLYSGTLDDGDRTWRRPYLYAGTCYLSSIGSAVFYDVHDVILDTAANPVDLSVSLCAGTSFDSVLYVYQRPDGRAGGFDPAAPCTRLIAYNDDYCGSASRVDSTALVPGHVTLVVTSFANGTIGGYGLVALSATAPLGDFVFANGFETADVLAWSAAVVN